MSLYIYPSNKLEYLVKILSQLLNDEIKDLFTPIQLVVGSRVMQSWLNIQLAEIRGISMNIKYDIINDYLLDIFCNLTNKYKYKKLYTKDILVWRIFKYLSNINSNKIRKYYKDSDFKKYQLSEKIAEVFSKYLDYRIDWLEEWENNRFINQVEEEDELWQMNLFQRLISEIPETPYKIQGEALDLLSKESLKSINIPNIIYIFGVNLISKKNLNFIFTLSKYIDVHILYINPFSKYCFNLNRDTISNFLYNYDNHPFFSSLGQLGKDYFNELLDYEDKNNLNIFKNFELQYFNFDTILDYNQSQLISLQRNLFELNCENYAEKKDRSISIHSCHSELREVQVLHDRLLDIIKEKPCIKPSDILIICPNIEDYAPYIHSVFSRYSADKKLSYSIVGRMFFNSDPLVAIFIDILKLPESNFEVNKILDYLSLPSIQNKFKIFNDNLETIRFWLKESCIHSGNNGEKFSWKWGLKRLMLGFSYSDDNYIINDNFMTIPIIEGSEVSYLGGLYALLEFLYTLSQELLKERNFEDWHIYLLEIFDNLFYITQEEQFITQKIKEIIARTINIAKEFSNDIIIDFYTIRYCLISQLSKPIINNHFFNGKVTFCSMAQMVGIPFRVVAMLGLNNGQFPRIESVISFDIMRRSQRRGCDITKKDNDRYLFLEYILSARDYLYFSYIGRCVKTNIKQEPSFVIKELINYLEDNYNWKYEDIQEYPLHPFSEKCYSKEYRSYDHTWLNLLRAKPNPFYIPDKKRSNKYITVKFDDESREFIDNFDIASESIKKYVNLYCKPLPKKLTILKLVNIFFNPLKAYVNYGLDLYLEDNLKDLEDREPFHIDGLGKYDLYQRLFNIFQEHKDNNLTIKMIELSGIFPDSLITNDEIDLAISNIQNLYNAMNLLKYQKKIFKENILNYELETNCYIDGNQILLYTTSRFTIKHKFELYLTALLLSYSLHSEVSAIYHYLEKNTTTDISIAKTFEIPCISYTKAKHMLEHYLIHAEETVIRPRLIYISLAETLMGYIKENNKKNTKSTEKRYVKKQDDWNKVISNVNNYTSLNKDEYFKLFYSEFPKIEDFEGKEIYRDFFNIINEI